MLIVGDLLESMKLHKAKVVCVFKSTDYVSSGDMDYPTFGNHETIEDAAGKEPAFAGAMSFYPVDGGGVGYFFREDPSRAWYSRVRELDCVMIRL